MVQRVGDDAIVFAEHSRYRPSIRRKAGLEDYARFHVLEARNLFFQLHVDLHRACNRAHRAGADAVLACSLQRCLA